MARVFLDSRSYIDTDTPQLPVHRDRPEPPRVEAKKLTKRAVLAKFRWDDNAFALAQSFGFPPAGRRVRGLGMGVELVWPEDVLDHWAEGLKARIRALKF